MYSVEIINHVSPKLSEKVTVEGEDDYKSVVERYFNLHKVTLPDYLKNVLTVAVVDLLTNKRYRVQPFHILFEPILIPENDTENQHKDRKESRQVDTEESN